MSDSVEDGRIFAEASMIKKYVALYFTHVLDIVSRQSAINFTPGTHK